MANSATDMLMEGRKFIDPIMTTHGFSWEHMGSGASSGGLFDSGRYLKKDRSLELHYRYSLGLVTYRIGRLSLNHEDYMRFAAPSGAAQYPGFSNDPLDGFRHLAHDLSAYAKDFLCGSGDVLRAAKSSADARSKLSGFRQLSDK